ncbi:type III pantothenate kinase [Liberiplasma polymorphum]|uniref:type III pantothenate kinase n=1 Tax=Liberiplasma polymorphum TaxID=3374570 RepID=UPI003775D914
MRLYIDIGNSNIVIGKGMDTIIETYRYSTDQSKSSDEYYTMLRHHFDEVDMVLIASVVPQLNTTFKTFIARYFNIIPMFIGPGIKTGVKLKTDNPKEVGADLVAGAAGAIDKYGDSAIIIDMGTATTFTYIEDKVLKGVSITIGLDSSRNCLVSKASKLLQFEFEDPKNVLGTNTVDALNAGLLFGHAFQVIGMVKNIKAVYNNKGVPVIITGGASKLIRSILPESYNFDENLILDGLIAIYKKNFN